MEERYDKNLIYERVETKDEIVIKYNTIVFYIKVITGLTGIWACFNNKITIGIVSLILLLAVSFLGNSMAAPVTREIKQAEKKGKISVTGKQYSFIKPVIVKIKK
jgi:hypothetical protein